jgi:hypothetical protein
MLRTLQTLNCSHLRYGHSGIIALVMQLFSNLDQLEMRGLAHRNAPHMKEDARSKLSLAIFEYEDQLSLGSTQVSAILFLIMMYN